LRLIFFPEIALRTTSEPESDSEPDEEPDEGDDEALRFPVFFFLPSLWRRFLPFYR
jgi:hypothetical protein